MKKLELLAPAGSMESLYAAVQAGCDAIYLGGSKFSARAYATNFTEEDMKSAVRYCHLYGVKIYVTINTLMKDSELSEAVEYVGFLREIGVDALIIQDTGLAYLVKQNYPDVELHASTQMTIHNGEGAKFYKDQGYERIVLSRELNVKEIGYISKDLDIETEIFVHGALCICYSGSCLMSSIIGGRSGNRGRCAQSCRLPYDLVNKVTSEKRSGYLLSPKDLAFLEHIDKIIESGTSSLKIEGRMKRPEYVAGVVSIYRKAIDAYYNKEKFNYKEELKVLAQLFNREGFSNGYLFKNLGKDLMSYNFPRNTGIRVGVSKGNGNILLEDSIAVGDGVRNNEDGVIISSIILNGKEVEKAFKGDTVQIKGLNTKGNDIIFKTSNEELLTKLSEYYKNPFEKKLGIQGKVYFKVDENIKLSGIYNNKEYVVEGDMVQKALKKPIEKEKLISSLEKTGNTVFKFNEIVVDEFEEGFLPISSINNVRRALIEKIEEDVLNKEEKKEATKINYNRKDKDVREVPKIFVSVQNSQQLKGCIDAGINDIAIDVFIRKCDIKLEDYNNVNLYIKTSPIIKEEFNNVVSFIEKNSQNIKGILTSNAGIIAHFNNKINIYGDYKINIFNKYTLDFYKDYLLNATLSIELNKGEITTVAKNSPIATMLLAYGKIEVMVSEHCPIGSVYGGLSENTKCSVPCEKGEFTLVDRKEAEFLVKSDRFCRSHIYNSVPINLLYNIKNIKNMVNSIRLDFIDEDYKTTYDICRSFVDEKEYITNINSTKGHFKRGVE
ncbi:MAG: DUF3656 domain-containing protein [Clostridiaceae bacterium]